MDAGMAASEFSVLDDFEKLSKLARNDPPAFEQLRKQLIEQLIQDAPQAHQINLRRFQWRIEQENRHHHNSLGRCLKLSSMMTERLDYLRLQIDKLTGKSAIQASNFSRNSENKVIPFKSVDAR